MNSRRILGSILLVGGIIALIVGMNASHSWVDQLSNTFRGRFTDSTTWYIIGGIAAAVVGLPLVLVDMRGRKA